MNDDLLATQARRACDEIAQVLAGVDAGQVAVACEALATAGRIALYGVGREGLQIKGLAMRLFHLGLPASVVGDMNCPPLGTDDLLVVSAGPGEFSTVLALICMAQQAGARVLVVTAQPAGACPVAGDLLLTVPAQTMADDTGDAPRSILPMGSLYEGALYVLFELLVLQLRQRLGQSPLQMRARHTNLE